MQNYFRLLSTHGDELALERNYNVLVTAHRPIRHDLANVVAGRLASRSDVVCLCANGPERDLLSIRGDTAPNSIALYQINDRKAEGEFALLAPFTKAYLTAPPIENGSEIAVVTAMAEHLGGWERFSPEPLLTVHVHTRVVEQIAAADLLLGRALTTESLLEFLHTSPEAKAILNAALPFISTSVLDTISQIAVKDVDFQSKLASTFTGDAWANLALPGLAKWLLRRESSSEPQDSLPVSKRGRLLHRLIRPFSTAPITSPAQVHPRNQNPSIGPDLDFLGQINYAGYFDSFPHACNARARRSIIPRKTVAILATARNEGPYLLEWLAYHRQIGVETFFIYSNNNDDDSDKLLKSLSEAGVIVWTNNSITSKEVSAQIKAYGHALGVLPDVLDFEWILVIDLDEFITVDPSRFSSIAEFCQWHSNRGADSVAINWLFIGSEEGGEPGHVPLIKRNRRMLTEAQMGDGVRLVKTMSRPKCVVHSEAHVPFTDQRSSLSMNGSTGFPHLWHNPPNGWSHSPKFSDRVIVGHAFVSHYIYKSAREWLWKNSRNTGDHLLGAVDVIRVMHEQKALEFMAQNDAADLKVSTNALGSDKGLESNVVELMSMPGVTEASASVDERYKTRLALIQETYRGSRETDGWSDQAKRFLVMAGVIS